MSDEKQIDAPEVATASGPPEAAEDLAQAVLRATRILVPALALTVAPKVGP